MGRRYPDFDGKVWRFFHSEPPILRRGIPLIIHNEGLRRTDCLMTSLEEHRKTDENTPRFVSVGIPRAKVGRFGMTKRTAT
jgi:hypothetical protein